MQTEPLLQNQQLLSLCAVLRSFDRDLLSELHGNQERAIEALLTSDFVRPDPEWPDAYQLRAELRAKILDQLRSQQAPNSEISSELELHSRTFAFFLQRLRCLEQIDRRQKIEDDCFYHLSELRLLLTERREWLLFAEYVQAIQDIDIKNPHNRNWLSFFEGYLAVQTQAYDRGIDILFALLAAPGLTSDLRVQTLNALGHAHWHQSRYDQALDYYQQTFSLACETNNLLYQGHALLNMSNIFSELENYEKAMNCGLQSLQIFQRLNYSYREAYALYDIGKNAMYIGQWQIAQNYFNQSIQLHESLKTMSGLAYLYWSQGFLFHILGDEAKSEAAYLQALSIAQSPSYRDLSTAIDTYSHLGLLYQTQHRWEEALDAYTQERILATQLKREHWHCMTYYRCGDIFKLQGRFEQALDAYREAIAGIENLRESTEGDEIKIGLLGIVQQAYEAMVLLCLDQGCNDEAYHYVEHARSRAFLDALAKKAPELFAAIDQPVVTLAEVQAQLPDGALLIEYYTTGVAPRGKHLLNKLPPENKRLREHMLLPPRIIIFAISRDHFSVHIADLDPNQLQPNPGDADPSSRFLDEALLGYLSERLLGPVADLLPFYRQLFLIPHGPLHYVPFQALRTPDGDYLLSAAGPNLAFAPSATVLLRNCFKRQSNQDGDLLALGYDDTGDLRLRYAEAEANYIAQLMGGQAWTGSAPKRERLAATSQHLRQLHIASHAVYNPHDPLGSELRVGAEDSLSARNIIGGMELRVELVTLSACTSGLSHVVAGDELLGLQRAFLYSGAPTVVCTLWDVVDLVALLVMERFYINLRQGQATAAALRDAQVMLREMTGHDLETIIARWCDEAPELAATLDLPTLMPEQRDEHILADPRHWAAFLLIGKPS